MKHIPRLNSTMPKLSRIGLFSNGYAVFAKPSNACIHTAVRKHETFQQGAVAVSVLDSKQSNTHNGLDHAQFAKKGIPVKLGLKKVRFPWPYSHSHTVRTCIRRVDQLHGSSQIHTTTARVHAKKQKGKKSSFMKEELSDQQKNVLRAVSSGKSVFVTGAAGTGKTYLLKHIIEDLKKIHGNKHVFVTASTGLAASALGGTTLHSFAGIGLGLGDFERLVSTVELSKGSKSRWKKAKALVIDEISMVCGDLFDKLNCIAKRIRCPKKESKEFGGLQLVVTGDFCQIPPVNPPNSEKYFAFKADCWDKCFDLQIVLTEIFRQSEDLEFMKMLNQIRMGICSPESISMLQACQGMPSDDGIAPTKLYAHKCNVTKENERKLEELGKELITFRAQDIGFEKKLKQLDRDTCALKEFSLCIGAQVMLIYNINIFKGLFNGRKGVVIGFEAYTSESEIDESDISSRRVWPIVKFQGLPGVVTVKPQRVEVYDFDMNGKLIVVARRLQIPLILAWAFTVHRCQGMTLDRIETDLKNVFDYGMVYVALSRLKKLDGLRLIGFHPSKVKAHPDVIDFYERLKMRPMIFCSTDFLVGAICIVVLVSLALMGASAIRIAI